MTRPGESTRGFQRQIVLSILSRSSRGHFRFDTEPQLPRRPALVQQHAEAVEVRLPRSRAAARKGVSSGV